MSAPPVFVIQAPRPAPAPIAHEGLWQRFWRRAPRQLKFTRAGQVLVLIAFATGFAALNTGNNLLFLSWGLVLATIVLSGILSESTLRALSVQGGAPAHVRAGESAVLPVLLGNGARRLPSYAVELEATVRGPRQETRARAPFQLKLVAGESRQLFARFLPLSRGRHELEGWTVRTAYPFGFFEKSRRFDEQRVAFDVLPRRVAVEALRRELYTQAGEAVAPRPGPGEDFFGLRPYRQGDDVRRVYFRRSAKTGRFVTRENQAPAGRVLLLELSLRASAESAQLELGIAEAGSLAELLLADGCAVGLLGPGCLLLPEAGDGQRWAILAALARLELDAPRPAVPSWLVRNRVGLSLRPSPGASALEVAP